MNRNKSCPPTKYWAWYSANLIAPFIFLIIIPFHDDWRVYLLFAIFSGSYLMSIYDARRRIFYIVVQLVVAAVLGGFFSLWELFLGFYPAIVMGMLSSYRMITGMTILMGGLFGSSALVFYIRSPGQWNLGWAPILFVLFWLPYLARSSKRTKVMSNKLEDANEEIARLIKNEERQRIARDLHDTLGHNLSMMTLKSELVERLVERDPSQAIQEAHELQSVSRSVLSQVRELINDMQSIEISDEAERARKLVESAGMAFTIICAPLSDGGPPIVRNILAMCLRECATNVVKHSLAAHCKVTMRKEPGAYKLIVEDDGVGIGAGGESLEKFGNGLLGMKERLLLIGGKLEVLPGETKGTTISITVPKVVKPAGSEGMR